MIVGGGPVRRSGCVEDFRHIDDGESLLRIRRVRIDDSKRVVSRFVQAMHSVSMMLPVLCEALQQSRRQLWYSLLICLRVLPARDGLSVASRGKSDREDVTWLYALQNADALKTDR